MKRPLIFLYLVICVSTFVSCDSVPADDKKSPPPPSPLSPSGPVCRIKPDFSSTEGELRTAIFDGDARLAAKILGRDETFGQGEGLRYLPEQECAVVRTENRRCDPDIVASRAIALSAQSFGGADRLANALVISFELRCDCSLFNSTERDRMKRAFRKTLSDPEELQEIIAFGGPAKDSKTECPSRLVSPRPDPRKLLSGSDRHLLQRSDGKIPTESLPCAFCDPPNLCNNVRVYCPPGSETG